MLTPTNTSGDSVISISEAQNVSGQTQKNQNDQVVPSNLTPLQQRKKDALDIAELIYDIYNSNCPVQPSKITLKGENDV